MFPRWLKIDSTEESETNIIGITAVVLAVNFMSAVFICSKDGLRARSIKMNKEMASTKEGWDSETNTKSCSQDADWQEKYSR